MTFGLLSFLFPLSFFTRWIGLKTAEEKVKNKHLAIPPNNRVGWFGTLSSMWTLPRTFVANRLDWLCRVTKRGFVRERAEPSENSRLTGNPGIGNDDTIAKSEKTLRVRDGTHLFDVECLSESVHLSLFGTFGLSALPKQI
ncbi:hypothetical protein B0H65DRAFT_442594 [Neurospora tetraspora]|uniref:Uncharacterized protein n=1 Tax=Neurospora tetraspora TaxID=94610 RepID=A0AAE0JFT2_9PEZI|nr:hypothetical protein B0H65DRAFT_442594 [Neurospora tetraspora]